MSDSLLSTRIPFAGLYHSTWSNAFDNEETQTYDNWYENLNYDRDRLEMDFPCLEGVAKDIVFTMLEKHGYDLLYANSNFRNMHHAFAKAYAEEFVWWLGESLELGELAFEFEEMTSPKFYNFETDRIFVKLSPAVFRAIMDRLENTVLEATFSDMFTSRDGFASFYDNQVPDKPLEEWDHNELYALLQAWVRYQDDDLEMVLYEGLYEEVSRLFSDNIDWTKMASDMEERLVEYLDEQGILPEDIPPPRCKHTLELPFM